ncbi:unnamed protein product [Lupinus luteus]|uniref:Reverse transcriptase domain-containing protein n=1 Tax=Lupinus luteus TaxID=3873 RepID=A0AAV1WAS4_LUPLU
MLWNDIQSLMDTHQGSWSCLGDFNVVLGADECRGPRSPARLPSDEFKAFTDSNNLLHLPTTGALYTWTNERRGNALTEKRLDRVLCNDSWIFQWQRVACCTLPRINSDHHPLLFGSSNSNNSRPQQFRFQKMWVSHVDCRRLIRQTWGREVIGCPMYVLSQKLKLLKSDLRIWNKNIFGDVHQRVSLAKANVEAIQNCIQNSDPDTSMQDQEDLAQSELVQALLVEEMYWKEKSRLNWHSYGDRNTSFFHKVAKIKSVTNSISFLKQGARILESQEGIADHVLNHFTELFGSQNNTVPNSLISDVIPQLVTVEDNLMLTSLPSTDEIKGAVFAMNGDGAPGPDGFGGGFFQEFWDIVGEDVCKSVNQFFSQSWLPPTLNSNSIILIPKVQGADKVEYFRPIALANFQFKIITKVMADRLGLIAPKIISTQQRDFVKNRKIQDCICIASEAVNLLHHKSFGGNMAIKLDIKKAFDTLDWNFLLDTLQTFGFNQKFRNWIRIILQSAMLSISVNGQSVGFFSCSRGVRQGDPLSPLLFCIAEDVLSRGISKLASDGKLSPILGPHGLKTPTHVLYADDILIFCKGNKRDLQCLKNLVVNYAQASGQQISSDKCKFYTANDSIRYKARISNLLGFSAGSLPFCYLGVPLFKGRPKKLYLQPIADRILRKLASWKGSSLSIMGRVELVKSIIQSMLLYSFHIYKWPKQLLRSLDSKIRNFIWSGNTEISKMVTVSWSTVCLQQKDGGLGIRSIMGINRAALLKLTWDMITSNHDWAIFYRERFGYNRVASPRYFISSMWSGLRDGWDLVFKNSIWLVGNGLNISFWHDNWMGAALVDFLQILEEFHARLSSKVSNFIIDRKWAIPTELVVSFPHLSTIINSIPISFKDRLVWSNTEDGSLDLKSAFSALHDTNSAASWCSMLWNSFIPPSKSFLVWRISHNKLPTDENLKRRGCSMASRCDLCCTHADSTDHLLLSCSFSIYIWNWLAGLLGICINLNSFHDIFQVCKTKGRNQWNDISLAAIVHTINAIWFCRNQRRFNDKAISLHQATNQIKRSLVLSGNGSNAVVPNSITTFAAIKRLGIQPNFKKAPKYVEVIWQPPIVDWIKANTDGAARGSPGHAGSSAIFRNWKGEFLGAFSVYLQIKSALYAELFAALATVDIAHNNGWLNLWIECDSSMVVGIFNGVISPPWKLQTRWENCRKKLESMNFIISHIFREGNACADKLANYSVNNRTNSWWNILPDFIREELYRNAMKLPNYRFRNL